MRYTISPRGPLASITRALPAACLAVLAACEVTAPLPSGAISLRPEPHYAQWWSMVEQCSGRTRPMSDIDWYMVPGSSFPSSSGSDVDGLYAQGPERIILAGSVVRNGPVVRHEMLHALLRRQKSDFVHAGEYFLRRCAGVVECDQQCVATSGPIVHPPVDAVPATAADLEISIEADSIVSHGRFGAFAWAPVTVTARNPRAVGILIPVEGYGGYRMTFSLSALAPAGYSGRGVYISRISDDVAAGYFAPGQVKREVFDLYLPPSADAYGNWLVGGGFSGSWVKAAATIRFTP